MDHRRPTWGMDEVKVNCCLLHIISPLEGHVCSCTRCGNPTLPCLHGCCITRTTCNSVIYREFFLQTFFGLLQKKMYLYKTQTNLNCKQRVISLSIVACINLPHFISEQKGLTIISQLSISKANSYDET